MEKSNETTTHVQEPTWPELLGSNNWDGLLDPLDLSLRRFILRCGDFCQCTYDSFNDDKDSDYAGSCRYGKKSLFRKVKFEFAAEYQVHSFLYATATFGVYTGPWDSETNFIGYIATSTDAMSQLLGRREIYVVWRGTQTTYEWINVAYFNPVSVETLLRHGEKSEAKVMNGWLNLYTSKNPNSAFMKHSAREQLQKKIYQLIREDYSNENVSIVLTGHSLGAALAVLSAFDLVENGFDDIPVSAVVFGCPRVGDLRFTERLQQHTNLKILHTKNKLDLITLYPLDMPGMDYSDAGILLEIDCRKSPYLRLIPKDIPGDWHNLQGILHVVAGWHGSQQEFQLAVKRSPALVNKSCDFLKDEYKIPASWWVVENKGMLLNREGDWVLPPPPDEDRPVPEFQ
ncbi:alpha/beta-Hydrolases superfamily protein [Perilla frutescens var. hirtella]|uniref:Phospholipase A1 n=1 Tax=Perilla frutescens var. hirtella TaxID=608512 RepID=A0AAD4JGS6_PERFH|nr:alpha/beta-Hydrolases superfamily protein [Perilla frutescens var. hirtella]